MLLQKATSTLHVAEVQGVGDTPLQTVANIRRHKDEVVVTIPNLMLPKLKPVSNWLISSFDYL